MPEHERIHFTCDCGTSSWAYDNDWRGNVKKCKSCYAARRGHYITQAFKHMKQVCAFCGSDNLEIWHDSLGVQWYACHGECGRSRTNIKFVYKDGV